MKRDPPNLNKKDLCIKEGEITVLKKTHLFSFLQYDLNF